MLEQTSGDRVTVRFAGAEAGTESLTWGQRAILQDMQASGNQFNMPGVCELPGGRTVRDLADALGGLVGRHAALRMRLGYDPAGRTCQHVAGSGELGLDVLTIPDAAGPAGIEEYLSDLVATWPLQRFDFHHDWPLRMAVVRHRGACIRLAWVLSHLVADGGAHLLLLDDILAAVDAGGAVAGPARRQLPDLARSEREPRTRQVSASAMRYWQAQLRDIPVQTFGVPGGPSGPPEHRYAQARFTSPAAHLAVLAVARRTGTDTSRATLAVITTAIGRATGLNPLTIKVMVNNRFRPGLADVIAPIAQNSVITVDAGGVSVDEVVTRVRSASLTATMRAYYDPDELTAVGARLDAERGHPAAVTCRINDQRKMVLRAEDLPDPGDLAPRQISQRLAQSTLTWLGPKDHMHEQVNLLIENRSDVLSLFLMWDLWSLSQVQVEAILRGVEEVAVEAAADPRAPTGIAPGRVLECRM